MMVQRTPFIILMLICALVLCFIWSLSAGAIKIPASTIINTLFDLDGPQQKYIINRSRLPRSLIAILCGGALALSGSIIQGILRNPLASPKIIGINSGAAFAVLSSAIITPNISSAWLPLIAAVGGIMAASLIYFLAELRSISPSRLILIGIAVGFMIDAGVEFILVTAGTFEISTPLIWLTGSLWGRGWQHLDSVWPLILALAMIAFLTSFRLDLLHLGSEQATGLGVNVRLERLAQVSLATLLAAFIKARFLYQC